MIFKLFIWISRAYKNLKGDKNNLSPQNEEKPRKNLLGFLILLNF